MLQAALFDGALFDPFSFAQDLFAAPEVDVSGCEVLQALVISVMIVVADELAYLGFEVTGQEVVLQKDPVFQGLMPSFDLALRLGVVWGSTHMVHAFVVEPVGQLTGEVT